MKSKKMIRKSNTKTKTKRKRFTKKGGATYKEAKDKVYKSLTLRHRTLNKIIKKYCENPDNCLALGPYGEYIKNYFEYFRKFKYIYNQGLKRIGGVSANGMLVEVPFMKNNYKAYTGLKCALKKTSDNLYYEYYVGKYFINKYLDIMPCFLETYDCYEFVDKQHWKTFKSYVKNNELAKITSMSTFIRRIDTSENDFSLFEASCYKNRLICVLIQHFDKFISFYDEYTKHFDNIKFDLQNIYYQILYPLCYLGDKYTHYDLHANNVFLYRPYRDQQCLVMRYHRNGNVIQFKTDHIVKLIDYGRNYFNNGVITSDTIVKQHICGKPDCDPSCGIDVGYGAVANNFNKPEDYYWINPTVPNVSHDLRFMTSFPGINALMNCNLKYINDAGTPEDQTQIPNVINNIFSALDCLEPVVMPINNADNEKKYAGWKVMSTIDIYDDGRPYNIVIHEQV
jgi:hypothetical protein